MQVVNKIKLENSQLNNVHINIEVKGNIYKYHIVILLIVQAAVLRTTNKMQTTIPRLKVIARRIFH